MRHWKVCIDPEIDDVDVHADTIFYSQDAGWLTFSRDGVKGHCMVFAPGKWVYFMEVTDGPATR